METISKAELRALAEKALAELDMPGQVEAEIERIAGSARNIAEEAIRNQCGLERGPFGRGWTLRYRASGVLPDAVEAAADRQTKAIVDALPFHEVVLTDAQKRSILTHYRGTLKDAVWEAVEGVAQERAEEVARALVADVLVD